MSGWIDMKRIGPMLLLAMALNGCAGPTSRQTGLLLSHMSIAVAVCASRVLPHGHDAGARCPLRVVDCEVARETRPPTW
jgi:hypothetical protein